MSSSTLSSIHRKQHLRSRPHRRVRVIAKIRDFLHSEIESSNGFSAPQISVWKPNGESSDCAKILLGDQTKGRNDSYTLDYCYEQHEDLSQIFSKEVKPLLPDILCGFNASVIVYGARGSGKTHLIQGSDEKPGLAPLAMAEILSTREEIRSSVMISYYEVYQDHVFDLLEPKEQEVLVFEDNGGKIKLKGLSQVAIKSISDFNRFYFHERNQRKPGQKNMSDTLRRSHKCLIIYVSCNDKDSNIPLMGKMNFIDLAGYEDRNHGDSPHPAEIVRINKSIYTLQKVVYSVNANERHVPYRETKLTHILQDCIGGTSRALMITCLNPSVCQDTICTVKLAAQSCQASERSKNDSTKKIDKGVIPTTPVARPKTLSNTARKSATSRFLSTAKKTCQKPSSMKGRKLFDVASPSINSMKLNSMISEDDQDVMLEIFLSKPDVILTEASTSTEENSRSRVSLAIEPFIQKEENPLPSVSETTELMSEQDSCLQRRCNHPESKDVGFGGKESLGSGDYNLQTESNRSPYSFDDTSPPISTRLREITNTLKTLCSQPPLSIQVPNKVTAVCNQVTKDLSEPKTPGVSFSSRVSDLESSTTGTPADIFKTHNLGLKKSLVHEYLKFLNSAGREELKQLKGIGEKRANYILELREKQPEPFKDLDGLKEIGLSTKQINAMVRNEASRLFT